MHAVNEFLHGPPTVDWNENTVSLFSCATFARLKKKINPRVLCLLTCMWLFSFHKHFLFWENSWRTTLVCMWKPYKNIPLLFCNQIFLCRIKGEGVFSTLQREIYWQSLSHSHTHTFQKTKLSITITEKLGSENECPFVCGKGQRRYWPGPDMTLLI